MLESLNEAVLESTAEPEMDRRKRGDLSGLPEITLQIDLPSRKDQQQIHGIITGVLTGFDEAGSPLVTFREPAASDSVVARSIVVLSDREIAREVVLMFESGDPQRPIVMGLIEPVTRKRPDNSLSVEVDGERVILTAEKEIVLRCGNASLTLTRAGKVLIRGAYVSSRSSGVNRIKGGSVQLN
jgi:Domain of unknown function (DUF6484)